jgi:hypothetical protein
MLTIPFLPVALTGTVQLLLWRDKRKATRGKFDGSTSAFLDRDIPSLQSNDVDEKKAVRTNEAPVTSLD